MKNQKYPYFVIILMCLLSMPILRAQDTAQDIIAKFKPELRRLYNGCVMLSDGVSKADCEMVGFATDSLNQDPNYLPKPVVIENLRVEPIDVTNVIPIEDCFDFTDAYALQWSFDNCNKPVVLPPAQLRGMPDCYVLKLRLNPKSKAVYTSRWRKNCKLFAIGEPNTDIVLELVADNDAEPVKVKNNVWVADWYAGDAWTTHTITLSNNSDAPSTIYLVAD